MNYRYLGGFLSVGCLGIGFVIWIAFFPIANDPLRLMWPSQIVFFPQAPEEPILPGQEVRFFIRMHSTFDKPIEIVEFQFSSDCASLVPGEGARIPKTMLPGQEVVVPVVVKADGKGFKKLQLGMRVIGGDDGKTHLGSAQIPLELLGYVNPDRQVVAVGLLNRHAAKHTARVLVWYPKASQPPTSYHVESSDRAVSVELQKIRREEVQRVYFAELVITVDPQMAHNRIDESVTLKSDAGEARVRVVGFVED